MGDPERVVAECRIELAAKILSRHKRQLGFKCLPINLHATSDETFIQPAQKVRKPSAVKLGGHDFETREAFQYTGHDQCRKSIFDFVGINAECDGPFLRAGVPIHPPKSGELV